MTCLSDSCERQLLSQESEPRTPLDARRTLEIALTEQIQRLTDSILGSLLLTGFPVSDEVWWQLFLARSPWSRREMDLSDHSFRDFRAEFVKRLACGQIRAIPFSQADDIELRIYGRWVHLWEAAGINKQLARLGSSYRFLFLGTQAATVRHVCRSLKAPTVEVANDMRYIWGRVGDVIATPFGRFYHYLDEAAVSPLLDATAPGFNLGSISVVRDSVLRSQVAARLGDVSADDPRFSEAVQVEFLHIATHEMIHQTPLQSNLVGTYIDTFWFEDTVRDICRFTQSARSLAEVRQAFRINFDSDILRFFNETVGPKNHRTLPQNLESILTHLEKKHVVRASAEGHLYCPLFEKDRIWVA